MADDQVPSASTLVQTPDVELARAMETSKVPALSRAAAILRLVGKSREPLGVQAIARALDIVPSTCLHILRALVAEELIAFDPASKRYSLDAGVLTLARDWLRRNKFAGLAQPELDRIAATYEITTIGVRIVELEHIIVVAISHAQTALHLHADIGSRFPALISATGRCIAAFGGHPWPEIEKKFALLRWDAPPAFAEWREQVEATRNSGYAIDDGNYIIGVTVVAAPVTDMNDQLRHAIIALGLQGGIARQGAKRIADDLSATAKRLSHQLSGD